MRRVVPGSGCPPTDAVGRLLRKVREYVRFKRRPTGKLQSEGGHRIHVIRFDVFGIGASQCREFAGLITNSFALYWMPPKSG